MSTLIATRIRERVTEPLRIMEVCGTHTVAISRAGIRTLLPDKLSLVSGPGCPVCVTDAADIDKMIAFSRLPRVMVATFGDMMRVPGSSSSLAAEKSQGADIRVVYSPFDAVNLASHNPRRTVVFLGVGFETTAPAVALAIEEAADLGLRNFCVYSAHKLVPPALEALCSDPQLGIQGFLFPGHVSTVLGRSAYLKLSQEYGVPAAIAGFEPVDILSAIDLLVEAITSGRGGVINAYRRAVREEGNPRAREAISRVFRTVDACWRGIGHVPLSGLAIREELGEYDAERRFRVDIPPSRTPAGCACGEVLKGKLLPMECPLFSTICAPDTPVGPCMVSSEGSCAAYYRYHRYGGPPSAGPA